MSVAEEHVSLMNDQRTGRILALTGPGRRLRKRSPECGEVNHFSLVREGAPGDVSGIETEILPEPDARERLRIELENRVEKPLCVRILGLCW